MAKRLRQRGVTTIEFAFLFGIFLNFSVGALEMELLYTDYSVLQGVADQTARHEMVLGSAGATTAGAISFANAIALENGFGPATGMEFAAPIAPCTATANVTTQCMTIVGTYTFHFTLLTMGLISIDLASRSVAPLE